MANQGTKLLLGAVGAGGLLWLLMRESKAADEPPPPLGGPPPAANGPLPGQPGEDTSLLGTFHDALNRSEYYMTEDLIAIHDELVENGYEEEAWQLWTEVIDGRLAAQAWIAEHGLEPQSEVVFSPEDFPTEGEYIDFWNQQQGNG